MGDQKIVAGYGRVSTLDQALKGTSAKDQQSRIKGECERLGYEWLEFYSDDGFSGKSIERRPGIQRLIRDAKEGKFNMVMFTKSDRLARNLRDLLNIWHLLQKELKVDIYCLDDPVINSGRDTAEMMLSLLGMFAQFERKIIKERTEGGRRFKWINGGAFIGQPPFGYRWNKGAKRIEIADTQEEIYYRVVSMYLNEHYSMKEIANKLTDQGIPSPSAIAKNYTKRKPAQHWSATTIDKMLRNTAYKGNSCGNRKLYETTISKDGKQYTYRGKVEKPSSEWIMVKFPPLISEEKWNQIQDRIKNQKFNKKRLYKGYEDHFLVENFIYCGECGGKMHKTLKQEKNGKTRFYYVCFWQGCGKKELAACGHTKCILKSVEAEKIDSFVYSEIVTGITNPGKFKEQWLKDVDLEETKKKLESLQKRKEELEKKIKRGYHHLTQELNSSVRNLYEVEHEKDKKEFGNLLSELKILESKNEFVENRFDRLVQFENAYKDANRRGKISLTFKAQDKFLTYLDGLPFKERKRIIEAIVSPETGGKCTVRYVRPFDYLDNEDIRAIPEEERETTLKKPRTDIAPLVEVDYFADLNKIEALITGLDRQELLNKLVENGISMPDIYKTQLEIFLE